MSAALLWFDVASPMLRLGRRRLQTNEVFGIGYPTLTLSDNVTERISNAIGVPVRPWSIPLTSNYHTRAFSIALERYEPNVAGNGDLAEGNNWLAIKANDRVVYRSKPLVLLELLLNDGIVSQRITRLLVPWRARAFDIVERAALFGLDAPAHALCGVIERLEARHNIVVEALWPHMSAVESATLPMAAVAMVAARTSILVGRSVRAAVRERQPQPRSVAGNVGFVVNGAPQWQMLEPLVRRLDERSVGATRVYASDIFRAPTAYQLLRREYPDSRPLDAYATPHSIIGSLARALETRRQLVDHLPRPVMAAFDAEAERLYRRDLDALPELCAYSLQLRNAIRRDNLRVVISGNCIDAYLSATTAVCRAEGIPHVCIQTAAVEQSPMPRLADCDVYFADSSNTASYLRSYAKRARVEALGLPYYDHLLARARAGNGLVRKQFPWLEGRRIVALVTQTAVADMVGVARELVRWAKSREDVGVVIKLHPRESSEAYADLGAELETARCGGRIVQAPLADVLVDCWSIVGSTSASILWAIIMGVRPFSCADVSGLVATDSLTFLNTSVTTRAADVSDLIQHVERDMSTAAERAAWMSRRADFIHEFVTGADGHASDRILNAPEIIGATR